MEQATVNQSRAEQPRNIAKKTLMVGTAPVNWNNDDLSGWRPHITFADMLDAMASAGYQGTEFGAEFPRDPAELKASLDARGLELCGSYQWFHFQDPGKLAVEIDDLEGVLQALAGVGCRHLIVASAMTPERIEIAGR